MRQVRMIICRSRYVSMHELRIKKIHHIKKNLRIYCIGQSFLTLKDRFHLSKFLFEVLRIFKVNFWKK